MAPTSTLRNLVAAIAAKDFASLPTYFCPEFAAQAAGLDLSAITAALPEGTDAQSLLDAFVIQADVQTRGHRQPERGSRPSSSWWPRSP